MFLTRLLLFMFTACLSTGVVAERINIVTTDFPPYSFIQDNQVAGLATEAVTEALHSAGLNYNPIKILPWARAYSTALNNRNTLIYSIARSTEREPLFHWVGKIAPYRIHLYKLKSRQDIQVHSLEDAKKYVVGGEFADIKQEYLIKKGFEKDKNLKLVAADELNIRMLFAGRIDLIPFDELSLPIMLEKEGKPADALESVLFLEDISYDLYMAFSNQTHPDTVKRLRHAVTRVKQGKTSYENEHESHAPTTTQ